MWPIAAMSGSACPVSDLSREAVPTRTASTPSATSGKKYQTEIDTHTADGMKVGLAHREPGVPLICLETALPAKFEASMIEALGRKPARPPQYEGIEALPQRFEVIDVDAESVKRLIAKAID